MRLWQTFFFCFLFLLKMYSKLILTRKPSNTWKFNPSRLPILLVRPNKTLKGRKHAPTSDNIRLKRHVNNWAYIRLFNGKFWSIRTKKLIDQRSPTTPPRTNSNRFYIKIKSKSGKTTSVIRTLKQKQQTKTQNLRALNTTSLFDTTIYQKTSRWKPNIIIKILSSKTHS